MKPSRTEVARDRVHIWRLGAVLLTSAAVWLLLALATSSPAQAFGVDEGDTADICVVKQVGPNAAVRGYVPSDFVANIEIPDVISANVAFSDGTPPDGANCGELATDGTEGYALFLGVPVGTVTASEAGGHADAPATSITCGDDSSDGAPVTFELTEAGAVCTIVNESAPNATLCIGKALGPIAQELELSAVGVEFTIQYTGVNGLVSNVVTTNEADTCSDGVSASITAPPGLSVDITETAFDDLELVRTQCTRDSAGEGTSITVSSGEANSPTTCVFTNESPAVVVCLTSTIGETAYQQGARSQDFSFELLSGEFDPSPDSALTETPSDLCADDAKMVPSGVQGFQQFFVERAGSVTLREIVAHGSIAGPVEFACSTGPTPAPHDQTTFVVPETQDGPIYCNVYNDVAVICVTNHMGQAGIDAGYPASSIPFTVESFEPLDDVAPPIPDFAVFQPQAEPPPAVLPGPSDLCENYSPCGDGECRFAVVSDEDSAIRDTATSTFLVRPGSTFGVSAAIPAYAPIGFTPRRIDVQPQALRFVTGNCLQLGPDDGPAYLDDDYDAIGAADTNGGIVMCDLNMDAERVCVQKFVEDAAYDLGFRPADFTFEASFGPVVDTGYGYIDDISGRALLTAAGADPQVTSAPSDACESLDTCYLFVGCFAAEPMIDQDRSPDPAAVGYAELFVRPNTSFTISETIPDGAPVGVVFAACDSFNPKADDGDESSITGFAITGNGPERCVVINDSHRVCVDKIVTEAAYDAGFEANDFPFTIESESAAAWFDEGETMRSSANASPGMYAKPYPSSDCLAPCENDQGQLLNGTEDVPMPCRSECSQAPDGIIEGCGLAEPEPADGEFGPYGFLEFFVTPGSHYTVTETIPFGAPVGAVEYDCYNEFRDDKLRPENLEPTNDDDSEPTNFTYSASGVADGPQSQCHFVNHSVRVCVAKYVGATAVDAGLTPQSFTFEFDSDGPFIDTKDLMPAGVSQVMSSPSHACLPLCDGPQPQAVVGNGDSRGEDGGPPCRPRCDDVPGSFESSIDCEVSCDQHVEGNVHSCEEATPEGAGDVGFLEFFAAPRSEFTITETIPDGAPVGPVERPYCDSGRGFVARQGEAEPMDKPEDGLTAYGYANPYRDDNVYCQFVNDSVRVCVAKVVGVNATEAGYMPSDFTFSLAASPWPYGDLLSGAAAVEAEGADPQLGSEIPEGCLDEVDCDGDCETAGVDEEPINVGFAELFVAPNRLVTVTETTPAGGTVAFPDAGIGPISSECFSDGPQPEDDQEDPLDTPDSASAISFYNPYRGGSAVLCTFINDSVKVEVTKEVENKGGGTGKAADFVFDLFGAEGVKLTSGSVPDASSPLVVYLAPNQTLQVAEAVRTGYELKSAECTVGDTVIVADATGVVTVDLSVGGESTPTPSDTEDTDDGAFILPAPADVNCKFVNAGTTATICAVQVFDGGLTGFTLADLGLELFDNGALVAAVESDSPSAAPCGGVVTGSAQALPSGKAMDRANATATSPVIFMAEVLADGRSYTFSQVLPANVGVSLRVAAVECSALTVVAQGTATAASPAVFTPTANQTIVCTATVEPSPAEPRRTGGEGVEPGPEPLAETTVAPVVVPVSVPATAGVISQSALAITGSSATDSLTVALSLIAAGAFLAGTTRRRRLRD